MKHIQIDLRFVYDHVQKGTLTVSHVHTRDQLADLLTKPLSHERNDFLRAKNCLIDGRPFLWGCIKEGDPTQEQQSTHTKLPKQSRQESCIDSGSHLQK